MTEKSSYYTQVHIKNIYMQTKTFHFFLSHYSELFLWFFNFFSLHIFLFHTGAFANSVTQAIEVSLFYIAYIICYWIKSQASISIKACHAFCGRQKKKHVTNFSHFRSFLYGSYFLQSINLSVAFFFISCWWIDSHFYENMYCKCLTRRRWWSYDCHWCGWAFSSYLRASRNGRLTHFYITLDSLIIIRYLSCAIF